MKVAGLIRYRVSLAVGIVFCSSVALCDPLSSAVYFNIPEQPIRAALIEFSKQADIQVMSSSAAIDKLQSVEVSGRFRGKDALRQLLDSSGLRYEILGNAVVVKSVVTAHISSPSDGELLRSLGDMVVTGTRIHGDEPKASQLIVLDRDAISKTGYSSVQDVVRTLTQVFGGGPSDDTSLGEPNTARSAGINLRGLGAGATLVLLNGRRIASGGLEGSFVDVSTLPLSAVSRIEVLPDGASAIYGSDAVGGVVNIIMRDDYQGAETQASYGSVTSGPLQETGVSQLWGTHWPTGHLTLSYEFLHRDALPAEDREFTADSDLRRLGGSNFSSRQSNPGTVTIGGQSYAIPRNQNGTGLTPDSFTPGTFNLQNLNSNRDVTSEQLRNSGFLSMSQSFGDLIKLSADALYARREIDLRNSGLPMSFVVPESNPYRVIPAGAPRGANYVVRYNFGEDLGSRDFSADVETISSAIAARVQLPGRWEISGSLSYGEENVKQVAQNNVSSAALAAALADPDPRTAFNPFGDGRSTNTETLDRIRRSTLFASDSSVTDFNAIAQGKLIDAPGGDVRLAFGADYRQQHFQSRVRGPDDVRVSASPAYDRSVRAAFAELLVPIVAHHNRVPWIERFQLSLAGRLDDYRDFGSTFNPRFGVQWSPTEDILVHSTVGRSFKAAGLAQLDERANDSYIISLPDQQSSSGVSSVLVWQGGNADLAAETAKSWSVGIRWSPDGWLHPTLDLAHFQIRFKDRIQEAPSVDSFLNDPRYAGIVHRDPTLAQRVNVCSRSQFQGNLGLIEGDCLTGPVAAIVDARFNNTRITTTRGFDLTGTMNLDGNWGFLDLSSSITYLLDFSEAQSPTAASTRLVDTVSNPLRFKMHNGISWSKQGFGVTAFLTYAGGYRDVVTTPNRDVGSWTTIDLQLSYEVGPSTSRVFAGCSFALTVQNMFDTAPPFVNYPSGVGYDRENADPLNRFVVMRMKKHW